MNNQQRERDEYLERLWEMKENHTESLDDFKRAVNGDYDPAPIDFLSSEGFVELDEKENRIRLTEAGSDQARRIIRAHRIGERLIFDIFGGDFETAACEFEHTVTAELVDGICTLLGHPRECPHGMLIPGGDCCRSATSTAHKQIVSLKDLEIGQTARVAYINTKNDRQMHRLDDLQIRPRTVVKVHQQYPCYVVECEGAHIALDEEIVSSICVWVNSEQNQSDNGKLLELSKKNRKRWRLDFIFGRKG